LIGTKDDLAKLILKSISKQINSQVSEVSKGSQQPLKQEQFSSISLHEKKCVINVLHK
jgi:hypothetical protein